MDFTKQKRELEEKFNSLEKEKQLLQQRMSNIITEQIRLQGEFRLLDKLEKEMTPVKSSEKKSKE